VWTEYLIGHPRGERYAAEVVRQNTEGWITNSNQHWTCTGESAEYRATIEEISSGLKKLIRRCRMCFLWGPFKNLNSTPFALDEIAIWPHFYKHEPTKIRMLINMSANDRGLSLNEHIGEADKYVRYISVRNVIERIVHCDLRYIWAVDALEAYCRVPLESRMMPLLGIKMCHHYFFYTCLVMGYAPSSKVYTEFGDCLQWMVVHRNCAIFQQRVDGKLIDLMMHYVDGVFPFAFPSAKPSDFENEMYPSQHRLLRRP
jgi:hypothetical protein